MNEGIYIICNWGATMCYDGDWITSNFFAAKRYRDSRNAIPEMQWLNAKPGTVSRWTVRVAIKGKPQPLVQPTNRGKS